MVVNREMLLGTEVVPIPPCGEPPISFLYQEIPKFGHRTFLTKHPGNVLKSQLDQTFWPIVNTQHVMKLQESMKLQKAGEKTSVLSTIWKAVVIDGEVTFRATLSRYDTNLNSWTTTCRSLTWYLQIVTQLCVLIETMLRCSPRSLPVILPIYTDVTTIGCSTKVDVQKESYRMNIQRYRLGTQWKIHLYHRPSFLGKTSTMITAFLLGICICRRLTYVKPRRVRARAKGQNWDWSINLLFRTETEVEGRTKGHEETDQERKGRKDIKIIINTISINWLTEWLSNWGSDIALLALMVVCTFITEPALFHVDILVYSRTSLHIYNANARSSWRSMDILFHVVCLSVFICICASMPITQVFIPQYSHLPP